MPGACLTQRQELWITHWSHNVALNWERKRLLYKALLVFCLCQLVCLTMLERCFRHRDLTCILRSWYLHTEILTTRMIWLTDLQAGCLIGGLFSNEVGGQGFPGWLIGWLAHLLRSWCASWLALLPWPGEDQLDKWSSGVSARHGARNCDAGNAPQTETAMQETKNCNAVPKTALQFLKLRCSFLKNCVAVCETALQVLKLRCSLLTKTST